MHLSDDEKYNALVAKDRAWDGAFYVGVTTTGIFCRTICTARKPKRENVKFYGTIQEALSAGFRPCKICRPMESVGKIPQEIDALIQEVMSQPTQKFKERQLRERGFEPGTLRRWFLKNYGMTFQAFCRMVRINQAYGALSDGTHLMDVASNTGYESVSGFSAAFTKTMGITPAEMRQSKKQVLVYHRFDTVLGAMIAIASDIGLCLLEFGDRRMLETEFAQLTKRLDAIILPGQNKWTEQTEQEILSYLAGERVAFDIPLHLTGSEFQQQVWKALMEIPLGSTKTYREQSLAIGNPNAVRAVGHANGLNKIAIIIPCHRVIGADGTLTGYGGGIWRKEWLLRHEKELTQTPVTK